MKSISLVPIGVIRSTRKEAKDDNWNAETASVELDAGQFSEEAMAGLSDFSHAEIIFYMDRVNPSKVEKAARHPGNNANWPKVGIFAQRGKDRPNHIGITICKIVKVEGRILHVEGLDSVEGTPVLDIKPWVAEFAPRGPVFQPSWMSELMRGYWQS